MPGAAWAYVVSFSAMAFSALSAFTLFAAVRHFDPPVPPAAADVTTKTAA